MEIYFYKYQGAGNDFILLDRTKERIELSQEQIAKLCDRHFGIGADGLMFLEQSEDYDFRMTYHNSDGGVGSLCGNGGRCIVRFAKDLGFINSSTQFLAADGLHHATIENNTISLSMNDVTDWQISQNSVFLNTGSPHLVIFVEDVSLIDVYNQGAEIRYSKEFLPTGTNVNFVEIISENQIKIRTYERGVENETLACGTGATAAALASDLTKKTHQQNIKVFVEGGELEVAFQKNDEFYHSIFLKGPTTKVFEGKLSL